MSRVTVGYGGTRMPRVRGPVTTTRRCLAIAAALGHAALATAALPAFVTAALPVGVAVRVGRTGAAGQAVAAAGPVPLGVPTGLGAGLPEAPDEQVAHLSGFPSAYRKSCVADMDDRPPLVETQLADVLDGDECAAVDADESRGSPAPGQRRQRYPNQIVLALRRVQAHVVTVGLGVGDGGSRHQPRPAGQFDGDRLVIVGRRPRGRRRDPADRLAEPLRADRLEQIVDGAHAES